MKRLVRWCVRHRDGWCACKVNRNPGESAWSVETACNQFVMLPYGVAKRRPTCPECAANTKVEFSERSEASER
jgi:hypothetical protein